MDQLYEFMRRLLANTPTGFRRYLYEQIDWNAHMMGLVGPRGVGKTTMFLQRVKELQPSGDVLYVSADHLYFDSRTLYETAEEFCRYGGKVLFIDEAHKYPGWSRELKNIYDALPDLQVFFAGSSVLDITKGEADLSRRAPRYVMQGLSFREFLQMRHGIDAPALSLDQIVAGEAAIPGVDHPLALFREYLQRGYYPFGTDRDFDIEYGHDNVIPLWAFGLNY